MNPIKTIIVEDEEANRVALRGMLAMYCPEVEIVAEAANVDQAHAAILAHRPHLALLDIRLEDRTVFDLLGRFEKIEFEMVFLTAYSEFDYAHQAIKFEAVDYLLKPYRIENLQKAVEKAAARLPVAPRSNPKILLLPSSSGQAVVRTEDVVCLEADGPYTTIFLRGKEKFVVSKNLKRFEETLGCPPFFRTHDSHMVNFEHVRHFVRDGQVGRLELANGRETPVSARRIAEFAERFREWAEG